MSSNELVESQDLSVEEEAQKRARWYARRRASIGSSEAAIVAGLRPFSDDNTPRHLWLQKLYLVDAPDLSDLRVIEVGVAMERPIKQLAAKRLDLRCRGLSRPMVSKDPRTPWMTATPDGLLLDALARRVGILECKNPANTAEWGREGSQDIPLKYRYQTHHEMQVSGFREIYVAAHLHGDVRIYRVTYDGAFAQEMIAGQRVFWCEHVLPARERVAAQLPAPPTQAVALAQWREQARSLVIDLAPPALDVADARLLHPKAAAELTHAADAQFRADVIEIITREHAIDAHERAIAELKGRLGDRMGQAELAQCGREKLICFKSIAGARRVDIGLLRERHPDIAAQCTVQAEPSRPLQIERAFRKQIEGELARPLQPERDTGLERAG